MSSKNTKDGRELLIERLMSNLGNLEDEHRAVIRKALSMVLEDVPDDRRIEALKMHLVERYGRA